MKELVTRVPYQPKEKEDIKTKAKDEKTVAPVVDGVGEKPV